MTLDTATVASGKGGEKGGERGKGGEERGEGGRKRRRKRRGEESDNVSRHVFVLSFRLGRLG